MFFADRANIQNMVVSETSDNQNQNHFRESKFRTLVYQRPLDMALKIEGFQAFLRKETQTQILQLNFSEPILAGLGLFLKLSKLSLSEL